MLRALTLVLPLAALLASVVSGPAVAQNALPPLRERAPHVGETLEALRVYEIIEIMAAEGVEAALSLEAEMFPGDGGSAWAAEANRIHGVDRLTSLFESAFPIDAFSEQDAARAATFFRAEPGASIAEAELSARRAFLDPDVEDRANEAFREAVSQDAPRLEVLTRFIEANDLVERNVAGALNSNLAFYRGLSDGGAFEVEVPQDLMLNEVWGQEPQLRRDTVEWLYSFQLAAYSGLSDADLEAYIAFSETPGGQALNAALFTAFDAMFEQISYELGESAAGFIAGEDA